MEFGLHYQLPLAPGQEVQQRYQDTLEQIILGDELGFDVAWLVELHFFPEISVLSAPLLLGAAAAARTERIRLGTGIALLPLHNPLRAAEEAATLDVISGGRLEYGIGRGFYRTHFTGFGVPYEERSERLAEGLEVLVRAWADEPMTYAGRFYQYQDLNVVPKPIQRPRPRVRMAAESDESFAFAASRGLPLGTAPAFVPHDVLRRLTAHYLQVRGEAEGAPPPASDIAITVPVYVTADGDQARAEAEASVMRHNQVISETTLAETVAAGVSAPARARVIDLSIQHGAEGFRYEDALEQYCAIGNPDEVGARLETFAREFHAGQINCWFNLGGLMPPDKVRAAMRLFAAEVRPRFAAAVRVGA